VTCIKLFKYLLENGQTGLSVAFDLPTLMGRDADDPWSEGEVGVCGVSVSSLRDMEILFDGINLEKVSTSMTINSPAAILLCMYVAVAEEQGVSPDKLRGTIQNDVLKEYFARGTYIFPPKESSMFFNSNENLGALHIIFNKALYVISVSYCIFTLQNNSF
jgi:methylmalonyl-CoA mutase N-terminal domain/subunit